MTEIPRPLRRLLALPAVGKARRVASGAACHLVGGALRDALLGLQSPDLDLVVGGNGKAYSAALAESLNARLVVLGGDRFSAFRLVGRDFVIDIWDRGSGTLRSDLERRDLTVNAMALDLASSTLHDPFRGLDDVANRRLRAVTESSFELDPLRVLRLARFALLLPTFSIENGTRTQARAASPRLSSVARERTRDELGRLFGLKPGRRAFELLVEFRAFGCIWESPADVAALPARLPPALDAYDHVEQALEHVAGRSPRRELVLAALAEICLGVAGYAGTGAPRNAPAAAAGIRNRYLTRRQERRVARLAGIDASDPAPSERRFLRDWGSLWLEAIAVRESLAPATGSQLSPWASRIATLVATDGESVLAPRPLLSGHDVTEILDLEPGPLVGRLLELLLEEQLEGRVGDRQAALRRLPELFDDAIRSDSGPL